jgi:hypothetical protein
MASRNFKWKKLGNCDRSHEAEEIERFFVGEDVIYALNVTGFNLQMAKHNAVANVTHAR